MEDYELGKQLRSFAEGVGDFIKQKGPISSRFLFISKNTIRESIVVNIHKTRVIYNTRNDKSNPKISMVFQIPLQQKYVDYEATIEHNNVVELEASKSESVQLEMFDDIDMPMATINILDMIGLKKSILAKINDHHSYYAYTSIVPILYNTSREKIARVAYLQNQLVIPYS